MPDHHRIAALLTKHGLATFPQPDDPTASRVVGGCFRVVEALAASLRLNPHSCQPEGEAEDTIRVGSATGP